MKNFIDEPKHFYFDGYDIDNEYLKNPTLIGKLIQEVNEVFSSHKNNSIVIPYFNGKVKEDGGVSAVILGNNFHFTCHTFCYKNTVFIDCFGETKYEEKLLPIILKYFPTTNFDLCKNNDKMGKFGKHVIFKINQTIEFDSAKALIEKILKSINMNPISEVITNYVNDKSFDILQPIAESHISVHVNNMTVIDVFSCKYFDEKKVTILLNNHVDEIRIINRGINYK